MTEREPTLVRESTHEPGQRCPGFSLVCRVPSKFGGLCTTSMELRTSREHRIENPGPTPLARRCGLLHAIAYDAKTMHPRRPKLGTRLLIASSLLFGIFMCYLTAFIAVDRGRLTVVSGQHYAPQFGNWGHADWPIDVPSDWRMVTSVSRSQDWGLRWTEWANDDAIQSYMGRQPSGPAPPVRMTDRTLGVGFKASDFDLQAVQEFRAGWPIACLRWWHVENKNVAVSRMSWPDPANAWRRVSWTSNPISTFGGMTTGTIPRIMPWVPAPSMLAANSLIWAAAFFAMASAIRWGLPPARRARRRRLNLCEHCAYPRDTFARCPECGTVHQT